jgi:hypothetical protein
MRGAIAWTRGDVKTENGEKKKWRCWRSGGPEPQIQSGWQQSSVSTNNIQVVVH